MCFFEFSSNSFYGTSERQFGSNITILNTLMNQVDIFNTAEYQFLTKPSGLPRKSIKADISFVVKNDKKFDVISTSGSQKLRVYKRKMVDWEKEVNLFKWRNQTNKPIVKVMYIQINQKQDFSGNCQQPLEIYTDHIAYNFRDIQDLSLAQTLYLLKKSICGFQSILQTLGYVTIDPAQCGITSKGDCKIWINQNLSENKGGFKPKLQQQTQIMGQILKIIKSCASIECQSFFSYLLKHIPSIEKLKFRFVDQFISQYCIKNQITIPIYLKYQKDSELSIKQNFSSNKTMDSDKFKAMKSHSTYSSSSKHRASQFISKDCSYSNKATQRISLVQKMPSFMKMDNLESSVPSFLHKKGSICSSNTFLRSTCNPKSDGENTMTKTAPSYSQFENLSKGVEYLSPINKSDQALRRGSHLPPNMMKSSTNQMASLNKILGSISEFKDQTADMKNDYIMEGSFGQLVVPSQKNYQKIRNKNNICHQFCINLISQKITAPTYQTLKKEDLQLSFTSSLRTKRQSYPKSAQLKNKKPLGVKYDSDTMENLNLSPRFSCEGLDPYHLKQTLRNSREIPKYKPKNCESFVVDKIQSATYFQENYFNDEEEKENRSVLYENYQQDKRTNKKRRNSRQLRETIELQELQRKKHFQQNHVLNTNRWRKVVSTLTEESDEILLRQSVSFEEDFEPKRKKSIVKLDMLDKLGHGLTESISIAPQMMYYYPINYFNTFQFLIFNIFKDISFSNQCFCSLFITTLITLRAIFEYYSIFPLSIVFTFFKDLR